MAIICHSSNRSSEYMKVTGEGVDSGNISIVAWKVKFENMKSYNILTLARRRPILTSYRQP